MLLDEIEHALEAGGAAVVRIGHVGFGHEEADLRAMVRRSHALQRAQVAPVHREDHVEMLEVGHADLPGALRAQVVAAASRVVLGALVGRAADMPVSYARGLDPKLDTGLEAKRLQYRFGGRRPADVSGANKEH